VKLFFSALTAVFYVSLNVTAWADCSAAPGGIVDDDVANVDQRQPIGTCSVKGLTPSACQAVDGFRHFKPDNGSGFTECFYEPRVRSGNLGPPPQQNRAGPAQQATPTTRRESPEWVDEIWIPTSKASPGSSAAGNVPYRPGYPFDQYDPPMGYQEAECGTYELPGSFFDKGPVRYSCRHTELDQLNTGSGVIGKFIARACARGPDNMMAEHNASSIAREMVFQMKMAKAKELGGAEADFIPLKADDHCVNTTQ
jgi:hypothetical protein